MTLRVFTPRPQVAVAMAKAKKFANNVAKATERREAILADVDSQVSAEMGQMNLNNALAASMKPDSRPKNL